MNDVLTRIGMLKLLPVVKIERAADAVGLGEALLAGGLPVAEITFRTDAAEEAIRVLCRDLPEMLVGAGTVLTVDNVKRAVDAGATFMVSPGFNPKVVDYCIENSIPVVPGVNSPTQIEMGLERGLDVLKFFPAEASGGIKLLKAMAAPYSGVRFVPTGGITANNLLAYLALDEVLACGGTWIAETKTISANRFDEITRLTREAVALIAAGERVNA
ncbi:MAG: bifunctional 4-hydroxy-2-oxoglutarate aldolase/2-dehydro-3-deoxy-phosphogluconate aldolase [Anaerolineae bacterium]